MTTKVMFLIVVYFDDMLMLSFTGATKMPKLLKNDVLNDYSKARDAIRLDKSFEIDSDVSSIGSDDEDEDLDAFVNNFMIARRVSKAHNLTTTSIADDGVDQYKDQMQHLRLELVDMVQQKDSVTNANADTVTGDSTMELKKKLDEREGVELPTQIGGRIRPMLQKEKDAIKARIDHQEAVFQQRLALIEQTNFISKFTSNGDNFRNLVEKLTHDLHDSKIQGCKQSYAGQEFHEGDDEKMEQ